MQDRASFKLAVWQLGSSAIQFRSEDSNVSFTARTEDILRAYEEEKTLSCGPHPFSRITFIFNEDAVLGDSVHVETMNPTEREAVLEWMEFCTAACTEIADPHSGDPDPSRLKDVWSVPVDEEDISEAA